MSDRSVVYVEHTGVLVSVNAHRCNVLIKEIIRVTDTHHVLRKYLGNCTNNCFVLQRMSLIQYR